MNLYRDRSKSMWIKGGAGLSAVIVVLFFSACTYIMRTTCLRTDIHVICTESLGTKNFVKHTQYIYIYINYLVGFYIVAGDFQISLRYNLEGDNISKLLIFLLFLIIFIIDLKLLIYCIFAFIKLQYQSRISMSFLF